MIKEVIMTKFISKKVTMVTEWIFFVIALLVNFLFCLPFSISTKNYSFFICFSIVCFTLLILCVIFTFDRIVISSESIKNITLGKEKVIKREDISKIIILNGKYPLILIVPNTVDLEILNYHLVDNEILLKHKEKRIIRFDVSKKNFDILEKYGYKIDGTINLMN